MDLTTFLPAEHPERQTTIRVESLSRYGTLTQGYSVEVRDGIECAAATPWHEEYKPRGLEVDIAAQTRRRASL